MWRGLHPNHIISFIGGLYMGFTPIFIKKRWTTLIFPYFKRPPTPTTPPPVRSAYRPPSRSLRFGCASQSAESPDDRAAEPDPYRPGSRGVAGNNPTKKGFFNGEHGDQLWDFEVYGIPDFQPNPCDFRWCSKMFFLNNTWFHPDLLQLLLWFLAHTGLKGLVGPMYLPPGTEGKRSSGSFI